MQSKIFSTGLRWLWVSFFVIILDRITKSLVLKHLIPYESLPVFPSFNLTLQYNRGSAFSFLNSASGWQVWMFGFIATMVSVSILVWMRKLSASQKWLSIALAFVVGGALGNLWDRFSYGHVVDFLDCYIGVMHWPVFNVADSAICIGAGMLFIDAIFLNKKS
jgi:signal peptidase II